MGRIAFGASFTRSEEVAKRFTFYAKVDDGWVGGHGLRNLKKHLKDYRHEPLFFINSPYMDTQRYKPMRGANK